MTDTYVNDAADRIAGMLAAVGVTLDKPVRAVVQGMDSGGEPPYWWLYPGDLTDAPGRGQDLSAQSYTFFARLVLGKVGEGLDMRKPTQMVNLWQAMPTVLNYFKRRRRMVYAAGQVPIVYLDPVGISIRLSSPFGLFTQDQQIGVEFQITVPFLVPIPQVAP